MRRLRSGGRSISAPAAGGVGGRAGSIAGVGSTALDEVGGASVAEDVVADGGSTAEGIADEGASAEDDADGGAARTLGERRALDRSSGSGAGIVGESEVGSAGGRAVGASGRCSSVAVTGVAGGAGTVGVA